CALLPLPRLIARTCPASRRSTRAGAGGLSRGSPARFLWAVGAMLSGLIVHGARDVGEAQPTAPAAHQVMLRQIYQGLVEINTTPSAGDTTRAAEAMARRLTTAGIGADDVRVLAPAPRKGNLVARLRGSGAKRPLLLLAHLDVVEAHREDWSMDPFTLQERD